MLMRSKKAIGLLVVLLQHIGFRNRARSNGADVSLDRACQYPPVILRKLCACLKGLGASLICSEHSLTSQ